MTQGVIDRFRLTDVSRGAVSDRSRHRPARGAVSTAIAAIIGTAFALGLRPPRVPRLAGGRSASSWRRLRGQRLTDALGPAAENPGLGRVWRCRAADPAAVLKQRDRRRGDDGNRCTAMSRKYEPFTPIIETMRGLRPDRPGDASPPRLGPGSPCARQPGNKGRCTPHAARRHHHQRAQATWPASSCSAPSERSANWRSPRRRRAACSIRPTSLERPGAATPALAASSARLLVLAAEGQVATRRHCDHGCPLGRRQAAHGAPSLAEVSAR